MSLGVHDRDQDNSDGNFGSVGKDLFAIDGVEDFGKGKASSMVAPALSPEPGWEVLDACAAPGNKTVHLAALMERKGRIVACELRKERIKLLKETIKLSGASRIHGIESYSHDFTHAKGSGSLTKRKILLMSTINVSVRGTQRPLGEETIDIHSDNNIYLDVVGGITRKKHIFGLRSDAASHASSSSTSVEVCSQSKMEAMRNLVASLSTQVVE